MRWVVFPDTNTACNHLSWAPFSWSPNTFEVDCTCSMILNICCFETFIMWAQWQLLCFGSHSPSVARLRSRKADLLPAVSMVMFSDIFIWQTRNKEAPRRHGTKMDAFQVVLVCSACWKCKQGAEWTDSIRAKLQNQFYLSSPSFISYWFPGNTEKLVPNIIQVYMMQKCVFYLFRAL